MKGSHFRLSTRGAELGECAGSREGRGREGVRGGAQSWEAQGGAGLGGVWSYPRQGEQEARGHLLLLHKSIPKKTAWCLLCEVGRVGVRTRRRLGTQGGKVLLRSVKRATSLGVENAIVVRWERVGYSVISPCRGLNERKM